MKYTKFIIKNYKAIKDPVIIDFTKGLIPIIGINECGKSTILKAILAFDKTNDKKYAHLKHLEIENFYEELENQIASIQATISLNKNDLTGTIKKYCFENKNIKKSITNKINQGTDLIEIERLIYSDPAKNTYRLITDLGLDSVESTSFIDGLIRNDLPHLIYYDDFSMKADGDITIPLTCEELDSIDGIQLVHNLNELIITTTDKINIIELLTLEENKRLNILTKAEKELNYFFSEAWKKFNLEKDPTSSLDLKLTLDITKRILKIRVLDQDKHFNIQDRSKGFYWFFNFVMRLNWNALKIVGSPSVFLLDEPGVYLHAFALTQLCKRLKQLSKDNTVVYTTHSHYLLSPETVPIRNILVASKDKKSIALNTASEIKGSIDSPFKTLADALQLPLASLELKNNIILTEGISDYYAFEIFKPLNSSYSFYPAQGATTIHQNFNLLWAKRCNFIALWDNDDEGKKSRNKAIADYPSEEWRFKLLPLHSDKKVVTLQDLFNQKDINLLYEKLDIDKTASFAFLMGCWYYSENKNDLRESLSESTKKLFQTVFEEIQRTFSKNALE